MKVKTCFKCGAEKPLSEYYKHPQMADGTVNKCKECNKNDVRLHRKENDSVRAYDRERGSRQDSSYLKEYRSRYPNKYKAHTMVQNAVKSGVITKADKCQECGSDFHVEGHHDDYLNPLDIRWLCSRCHKLWHRDNGEALNGCNEELYTF